MTTWNAPRLPPQPFSVQRTNALAVGALICAFILPPLGIVLACVAVHQINRSGEKGRTMAGWAIVLGYIFSILAIAAIILVVTVVIADLAEYVLWFITFQWAGGNAPPSGHFR